MSSPATRVTLPLFEVVSYFVVWVGGLFYSAYNVYVVSDRFSKQFGPNELEDGWAIIGRPKDISDYEWRFWLQFLWDLVPWFFIHHVIAEVLRWHKDKVLLRLWYVLISVSVTVIHCGCLPLMAMSILVISLFFFSKIGIPLLCWVPGILCLLSQNAFEFPSLSDKQSMVVYACLAWIQLRCTSFCLDVAYKRSWANVSPTEGDPSPPFLRYLSYTFYLPLMFFGPFVSFKDFEEAMDANITSWKSLESRIFNLAFSTCRFLFWLLVTEICLHFIYCNALPLHHEVLPSFDAWTLNGLAYCIGQFFLNKYVVVYGLMGALANFDAVSTPPLPRCIAHISMYSDMWRHFDRGFYNFLRSYIYDPLLEKFPERRLHILRSCICFTFVYVWHGLALNIFIWSICNFLGILVETLGWRLTVFAPYQHFEKQLSSRNVRRWRALASSPLFIMSALTMFFFLGGMQVGLVLVSQIVHGSLTRNFALLVFAYCMCQVSLEIKILREKWVNKRN